MLNFLQKFDEIVSEELSGKSSVIPKYNKELQKEDKKCIEKARARMQKQYGVITATTIACILQEKDKITRGEGFEVKADATLAGILKQMFPSQSNQWIRRCSDNEQASIVIHWKKLSRIEAVGVLEALRAYDDWTFPDRKEGLWTRKK